MFFPHSIDIRLESIYSNEWLQTYKKKKFESKLNKSIQFFETACKLYKSVYIAYITANLNNNFIFYPPSPYIPLLTQWNKTFGLVQNCIF